MLWLLESKGYNDIQGDNPWVPEYDKHHGHVISAPDEATARQLAADAAGDEGAQAWLDSRFSTCAELVDPGSNRIILSDFHAG